VSAARFLPVYFERLDAGDDVLPLLGPEFTFSLLWATPDGAHEFAGGLDEFKGYLAQRNPDGQLHHISQSLREGRTEVASGWTTRHGAPLGTFVFALELDGDERMKRLFAARTEAFSGLSF
jgi:hypothetical protein